MIPSVFDVFQDGRLLLFSSVVSILFLLGLYKASLLAQLLFTILIPQVYVKLDSNLHNLISFSVSPNVANRFLDKNLNREAGLIAEPDPLNNLTGSSAGDRSVAVDQNLNVTLSSKGAATSQPLAMRPPSLSVRSPLNKPDPSEVDDQAPVVSDSSPDSNLHPSHDVCVDPDLLNGNMTSDAALQSTKQAWETADSGVK